MVSSGQIAQSTLFFFLCVGPAHSYSSWTVVFPHLADAAARQMPVDLITRAECGPAGRRELRRCHSTPEQTGAGLPVSPSSGLTLHPGSQRDFLLT